MAEADQYKDPENVHGKQKDSWRIERLFEETEQLVKKSRGETTALDEIRQQVNGTVPPM